ncbi:MAG: FHA domain-containing protein [Chloroflexota bacterium]
MRNRFDTRDSLDETHLVAELAIDDDLLDEDEVVSDEDITTDEDITYTTTKMPHMDDEDGLLHIGAVRFRGNLLLKDKEHGIEYRLNNNQLKEAIIGRLNARTGFRPQIDFTHDNGKKRGVSRRHATITQRGDLIFVTDHNSLNGTYLNGQRLVPEQARLMRDSDSLRIGHISLIVIFEDDDTDE